MKKNSSGAAAWFLTVVLLVCAILPAAAYGFSSWMQLDRTSVNNYESSLEDYYTGYLVGAALQTMPDYDPIIISADANVPSEAEKVLRDDITASLKEIYGNLRRDANVHVEGTVAGKTARQNGLPMEETDLLEFTLKTDDKGHLYINDSYVGSTIPLSKVIDIYALPPYYSWIPNPDAATNKNSTKEGDETEDASSQEATSESNLVQPQYYQPSYESIALKLPASSELNFVLPQSTINDGQLLSKLIYPDSQAGFFWFALGLLMAGLLGLLILLVPVRIEEQAPVFQTFIRQKGLAVLVETVLLGVACVFAFTYITMIPGLSLEFEKIPTFLFGGAACLILSLLLFVSGLIVFYVKHIFTSGFMRWIREDTILGAVCRWVEIKSEEVADPSRPSAFTRTLVSLLLVAGAFGTFELYLVRWTESVLPSLVLLAVTLFLLGRSLKKVYERIRASYEVVENTASLLADGDLDKVTLKEAGVFSQLEEKLLNIQPRFETAVNEALSSQKMRTELISNVSHDLKTPLTGLKNYVELLENTNDPEEMHEYGERIARYTDRLDQLIVDLFDVTKANSGSMPLDRMDIDLKALTEQVVSEHISEWEKRGLQPVYSVPDEPVIVNLDPEKTMRMVENLVVNITKYGMENTRVFIELFEHGPKTVLVFKNTSRFPLDFNTETIKERFTRGNAARTEAGSGLGLAIVDSFAQIQDGTFQVEKDGDLFKAVLVFEKPVEVPETMPELPVKMIGTRES